MWCTERTGRATEPYPCTVGLYIDYIQNEADNRGHNTVPVKCLNLKKKSSGLVTTTYRSTANINSFSLVLNLKCMSVIL